MLTKLIENTNDFNYEYRLTKISALLTFVSKFVALHMDMKVLFYQFYMCLNGSLYEITSGESDLTLLLIESILDVETC